MKYEKSPGIHVKFEKGREVDAIREAFIAYNTQLRDKGNDSSVSEYAEGVAQWDSSLEQTYIAPKAAQLMDPVEHYAYETESDVDRILDDILDPTRISRAARRYELGAVAQTMLQGLKHEMAQETEAES